jgi:histidinol dehydrogenase
MPTGGSARWSSPLSVNDFLKITSVVNVPEEMTEDLARAASVLARAEGLTGHAHAVEKRLQGR